MTRTTNVVPSKARRKAKLKRAKGFVGKNKNSNRHTSSIVKRAYAYEYVGRKLRKRDFRSIWISRIGIAARINGTTYSSLMSAFKKKNVLINRQMLADIAVRHNDVFAHLVKFAAA